MRVLRCSFPGDPPAEVAIMSPAEFHKHYAFTLHEEEDAYACGADFVTMKEGNEIICDGCSKDIAGEVYMYRYESPGHCRGADRAYCEACASKDFLPYCEVS